MKGHMDNINRLAAEGKLAVAGPFGKNDKALRGLFILAVPTVDEAFLPLQQLGCQRDPRSVQVCTTGRPISG